MHLLALTGGIAMGKSTVARMLSDLGSPVVDTDLLARELVEPGEPALGEIVEALGTTVLDETGSLRRAEVARLVFSDREARRRLERILHPRIRERWRRLVETWRAAGKPAAVVVIPLLFETEAAGEFDAVLCVACSRESQRERLAARGWSPGEAQARLESQWPIEQKMDRSDGVVWTEGELAVTEQQVGRFARQFNLHPSFASVRIRAETIVP